MAIKRLYALTLSGVKDMQITALFPSTLRYAREV